MSREEKIQTLRDAHRQHAEESKRIGRMFFQKGHDRAALTRDKRMHDEWAGKYATALLFDYGVGTSYDD